MSEVNFIVFPSGTPHTAFIHLAAATFPAIAEDLLDEFCAGLIHLQVACLARYANACLQEKNLPEFERIVRFVEQALPQADSALDNALHDSFIENLRLDGSLPIRRAARALLPTHFREFYVKRQKFWGISPDVD